MGKADCIKRMVAVSTIMEKNRGEKGWGRVKDMVFSGVKVKT